MLAFFSPPVIFRICGSGCLKSFSGVWIHRYSVSARTIHIISAEIASVKAFYAVFTRILEPFLPVSNIQSKRITLIYKQIFVILDLWLSDYEFYGLFLLKVI